VEKNLILAMVLSAVVLTIYSLFVLNRLLPPPEKAVIKPPVPVEEVKEESLPEERELILNNSQLKIAFTSKGGVIKSWYLKDKKKELLREDIPSLGLTLLLPEGKQLNLDKEIFQPTLEEDKRRVSFVWEDEKEGYRITKTFELSEQGYSGLFTLAVENLPPGSRYQISMPKGIEKSWGDEEQLVLYQGKLLEERKQGTRPEYGKGVSWAGLRQKREFLFILTSLGEPLGQFFGPDRWGFRDDRIKSKWIVYAGPQNYSELMLVNNEIRRLTGKDYHLTKAISLSLWGRLSVGLIKILVFFYSFTHNYGVAIILLTLLIYVVLFPLTFKQFKSMQKMQALQPELAAIQKKFKNDPERLQVEMMNVYRKHKVNPMSGCLPMLIQLPIIFILYRAILDFNFSENPSFLWIKDLGRYDIPLLLMVAATMFLQQRISQRAQPKGQEQEGFGKVMQFFPLFIIVLLWSLPSAVMLYWFVSTLFSLVQQLLITKKMMPGGVSAKK